MRSAPATVLLAILTTVFLKKTAGIACLPVVGHLWDLYVRSLC